MPKIFPDPESADPDGLLAVGGTLEPSLLLEAYRNGIFPWSQDPVTWWCPPHRAVFKVGSVTIDRGTQQLLDAPSIRFTCDRAFSEVIRGCAAPRKNEDTWIGPRFITAYSELHRMGIAHSVECWEKEELVGGLYGLAIGGMFAGESMFYRRPDASKAALAALDNHLRLRGFKWIDSQVPNPFTTRLGAQTITRKDFLQRLKAVVRLPVDWGEWSAPPVSQ
jgi:leucyl/phenylalanyl-tRNA--protein transferase